MQKKMFRYTNGLRLASVLIAGWLTAATSYAHTNPVDPVSNPQGLSYSNVHMTTPKYDEPFQRDGIIDQPQMFQKIRAGLSSEEVTALIGAPLNEEAGKLGTEWNYNFKFLLPQSENYMVCQYKVVFDAEKTVRDTVWRRQQCLNMVLGKLQ